mgnify:CR=1 FL=1
MTTTTNKVQEALSELNLGDMTRIIEALFVAYETAQNEEKYLIGSTLTKIILAKGAQMDWLYKEYSN